MLDGIAEAAAALTRPDVIIFVSLGSLFGWILGALPGLGSIQGLILVLPFTYGMEPLKAMYLYSGILGAVFSGGAVPSILIRIPGTGANIATTLDGHPMAQRGEAAKAIGIAAAASSLGTFFTLFLMILLLPVATTLVLAFGPPEMFMLVLWGLTSCVVITRGNVAKGLIAAFVGLALSYIGLSNVSGITRYAYGSTFLSGGIQLVPFFVGLFGFAEVISLATMGTILSKGVKVKVGGWRQAWGGAVEVTRHPVCFFRSSFIGMIIGIIPGIGGAVGNLLSYIVAAQSSKHPETFGRGDPEGVIAAETANNATQPGALLTTVAFGVPGSLEMAVMIGIFMLHGLNPGPMFLKNDMAIVWGLILGYFIANIIAGAGTILLAGKLAAVTRINVSFIIPLVAVVCVLGVFVIRGNILDVFLALLFGLFGFGMERYGFSRVSMCIGFVMGTLVERSLHQTLGMSFGSYSIFFTRPISLVLFLLVVLTLAVPFLAPAIKKRAVSRA